MIDGAWRNHHPPRSGIDDIANRRLGTPALSTVELHQLTARLYSGAALPDLVLTSNDIEQNLFDFAVSDVDLGFGQALSVFKISKA